MSFDVPTTSANMRALVGFAGFDGPGIALREVDIEVIGIENDPSIAEVNRVNGGCCLTMDILDVDPTDYIGWLLYHFSPPCPSFSVASQGGETEMDLALAHKICHFIRSGRPVYFTMENVWGYRKSLSWHLIQYTLLEEGYGLDAWNLNSADYGVAQSRRRMIVIARRDGRRPAKPWPTHSKAGDMFTEPWRGWYSAVEDLIPALPETQPAPWQVDRMPDEMKTFLIMTGNTNRNGVDNVKGRGVLEPETPANTVSAGPKGGAMPRAFILGQGSRSLLKSEDEPADTVTANNNQTGIKAVIIGGGYQTPSNGKPRIVQNRGADCPIWTICASDNLDTRIWQSGRWVSMSVRCLARFQGFADSFILPGEPGLDENIVLMADPRTDRELTCRGIGNALPAGVYRAVLRSLDL